MPPFITVVSGLPRSGTSMLMKMLQAGGLPPLTDSLRAADHDNPNGYYEFERVKALPQGDTAWLAMAEGRALKVIAALVPYLPDGYNYRILFLQREMREVLASQKKMLQHRGAAQTVNDEALIGIFQKSLRNVNTWIRLHTNVTRLDVNYNELIHNPAPAIEHIRFFLDLDLDPAAMLRVVDPSLYRQRADAEAIHP